MMEATRGLVFAVQIIAVYVCASYLNLALFALVALWSVTRSRLSGRGPMLLREGLEACVFGSVVVHMYTNGMLGQPQLFVRKAGDARCRVSSVESTETMLGRANSSACGLSGYEVVPARSTYDLRPDDARVFLTAQHGVGGEILQTCAQLGVSCFQWRVAGQDGVPPHTPAVAMLQNIFVLDVQELYVAAAYTQNAPRHLHAHQLSAGGENTTFTLHSPLQGRVPLRRTGAPGVWQVQGIDTEISGEDTFVVVHSAERAHASGMFVSFSRFCTHNADVCDGSVYANTNQFFRLAQISTPHPVSLYSTVSMCAHPMHSSCGYSFSGGVFYLSINVLIPLSCLLQLRYDEDEGKPRSCVFFFLLVIGLFSINWLALLALFIPPRLARPVHAYSTGVLVLLLVQLVFAVYWLAEVRFGVDERYVTARGAHLNYLQLLLLPCSYFAGSVYVQGLAFSVLSAVVLLVDAGMRPGPAHVYELARPDASDDACGGGARGLHTIAHQRPVHKHEGTAQVW